MLVGIFPASGKETMSGLRKIEDAKQPCLSPEHNPPMNIYLEPGTYEYVCPSCGERVVFVVPMVTRAS